VFGVFGRTSVHLPLLSYLSNPTSAILPLPLLLSISSSSMSSPRFLSTLGILTCASSPRPPSSPSASTPSNPPVRPRPSLPPSLPPTPSHLHSFLSSLLITDSHRHLLATCHVRRGDWKGALAILQGSNLPANRYVLNAYNSPYEVNRRVDLFSFLIRGKASSLFPYVKCLSVFSASTHSLSSFPPSLPPALPLGTCTPAPASSSIVSPEAETAL